MGGEQSRLKAKAFADKQACDKVLEEWYRFSVDSSICKCEPPCIQHVPSLVSLSAVAAVSRRGDDIQWRATTQHPEYRLPRDLSWIAALHELLSQTELSQIWDGKTPCVCSCSVHSAQHKQEVASLGLLLRTAHNPQILDISTEELEEVTEALKQMNEMKSACVRARFLQRSIFYVAQRLHLLGGMEEQRKYWESKKEFWENNQARSIHPHRR